jgi:hypothetical protein
MADTTAPVVSDLTPSDGAVNIAVDTHVTFDILDPEEVGTGAASLITLAQHFGHENLSGSITGLTAIFTTATDYRPGTLLVWLNGILQTVTETDPAAGTFTLVAAPLPGDVLVADYIVNWQLNAVDVSTISITFDSLPVMTNGVWEPSFSGTITPKDFGYTVDVDVHADFPFGTSILVEVTGSDLAEPPNAMSTFTWTFTTLVPLTRRRPFITAVSPSDGSVSVSATADMSFSIRTDDLLAVSIDLSSVSVTLNGTAIVTGGVNVLPAEYGVAFTPGLRMLDVVIDPVGALPLDQHYSVVVAAADDIGTVGGGSYEFSTGSFAFAVVMDRTDPLLCPNDNVPVPLFTRSDVSATQDTDMLYSPTTDWARSAVAAYDTVEVSTGPDAGRWLVREPGNTTVRLYHVNRGTSVNNTAAPRHKTQLADRNPVQFITSAMMDLHHQKLWGDVSSRYLVGYPSDDFFPAGWESAVYSVITDTRSDPVSTTGSTFEDQNNRRLDFDLVCSHLVSGSKWDRYSLPFAAKLRGTLTNTATVTSGSDIVAMSGVHYRSELTVGATLTFGTDTTQYTVATIDTVIRRIILTEPWAGTTSAGNTIHRLLGGTRTLTAIKFDSVTSGNANVFIGLNNSQSSPVSDGSDRAGAELCFGISGAETVRLRAYCGSVYSEVDTGISHQTFCSHEWAIETELLDESTVKVQLLDPTDLTATTANRSATAIGVAMNLDRWSMTSLGGGLGPDVRAIGYIRHVDVEFGQGGIPYVLTGNVDSTAAKYRAPQNVRSIAISGETGWRQVTTEVAVKKLVPYATQYAQMFFDTDETHAFIDSYSIDGGATKLVDNRLIKKFSFKTGFNRIHLTFHANKRGYYHVLVDSADTVNGFAIARGVYEYPGQQVSVTIPATSFKGLAEGLHQVHIVVCKDPIPALAAVLQGEALLTAVGSVL